MVTLFVLGNAIKDLDKGYLSGMEAVSITTLVAFFEAITVAITRFLILN